MVAPIPPDGERIAMALSLELSGGRRGATARVTLRDRACGRVVLLEVHGWLDGAAVARLGRTLDDLGARGVEQLLLDGSEIRHIDYRSVPELVAALTRFETRAGAPVLCGLTGYVRDLIRLAGGERLRCWPSSAELLALSPCGPGRERAS